MAKNEQKSFEEILEVFLKKIPPIYHNMIPDHLSSEQKVDFLEEQEKNGIFRTEPYFMWLDRPRGSGLYTGPGTGQGTGPGTGSLGNNVASSASEESEFDFGDVLPDWDDTDISD